MSVLAIRSGIDRKLYRLTRPVHSEVSARAERPRDVEAEAGGQRPTDTEVGGLRSGGLRSGGLRSGGLRSGGLRSGGQRDQVRSPNQEVLDQRNQDLS